MSVSDSSRSTASARREDGPSPGGSWSPPGDDLDARLAGLAARVEVLEVHVAALRRRVQAIDAERDEERAEAEEILLDLQDALERRSPQ